MLELREELKHMVPANSAFEPPWTTLNVGALNGGSVPNVIAPQAHIEWEMRPVQPSDATFLKQSIKDYCDEMLVACHARGSSRCQN